MVRDTEATSGTAARRQLVAGGLPAIGFLACSIVVALLAPAGCRQDDFDFGRDRQALTEVDSLLKSLDNQLGNRYSALLIGSTEWQMELARLRSSDPPAAARHIAAFRPRLRATIGALAMIETQLERRQALERRLNGNLSPVTRKNLEATRAELQGLRDLEATYDEERELLLQGPVAPEALAQLTARRAAASRTTLPMRH